eukprot:UN00596
MFHRLGSTTAHHLLDYILVQLFLPFLFFSSEPPTDVLRIYSISLFLLILHIYPLGGIIFCY